VGYHLNIKRGYSFPAVTDEFLVCPTVFFAAKMRKIRNKPDGIHFLWFLCLFAAN
jgi:hypothetical protein